MKEISVRKFFKKPTAEEKESLKKERLEKRAKLTLAFQLGIYVGEQIISKHLPTLSVDGIHTNKNISVTCAEGDECRRLSDVWFNKRHSSKTDDNSNSEQEWKALRAHHEMLEEKYLPKTVECHFSLLNVTENYMEDFKKGIGVALWDCDCSHYSVKPENIDVAIDESAMFTVITLKKE